MIHTLTQNLTPSGPCFTLNVNKATLYWEITLLIRKNKSGAVSPLYVTPQYLKPLVIQ